MKQSLYELNNHEFIIDTVTGKKVYKPSSESTQAWIDSMDAAIQQAIDLYESGKAPWLKEAMDEIRRNRR
jgi:hypothetical protein